VDADDWREWQGRFQAHLQRYGHTIYNLDFANPVPADDPAPLLETCKLFISGQGVNPHARQQASAERREQATHAVRDRLRGLRLKLFRKVLAPARRYAPLREDGLADVGLSYPLLRQMLREVGHRFVEGGMIETPDDIFWLNQAEVEQAAARLDRGEALRSLARTIPQRKATWRAARRAAPPLMLPQMKLFGIDLMEIKSGSARKLKGDTLKGVAASPGSVTGPACVLHGPEEFSQMKIGDVLVAPLTTPAWTPLFARAAAVVTDVGGPLSHGSIVAREYGIPAVLGTGAATKRIRSGQTITVDGDTGVVTLLKTGELNG
jgi:pyruvate,water dikinase